MSNDERGPDERDRYQDAPDRRRSPDRAEPFDPEIFDDFVTLLGVAGAQDWIDGFRAGLVEECLRARPFDAARSRASLHNICARAGLIGLPALHAACLTFLESGAAQDCTGAAYRQVCAEAERALVEIDRHRATLS